MKMHICIVCVALSMIGCTTPRMMMDREYQERPKLETSLFRGDQDFVSEDAVQRILSTKVQIPQKAKIAIFKYEGSEEERFASTYYGYYYWRSENYIKLQQAFVESLQSELLSSGRVVEATILPSLLVPKQPSISMLRQAAVRLQADLIAIYRITGDVYYDYQFFEKDKIKAYSNCEIVLFDTRTGTIPFSSVASRDLMTVPLKSEIDREESMQRAQKEASLAAISTVGKELSDFLKKSP